MHTGYPWLPLYRLEENILIDSLVLHDASFDGNGLKFIKIIATSISELIETKSKIKIYPNQSSNYIAIKGIDNREIRELKIYNIHGQLLIEKVNIDNTHIELPEGFDTIDIRIRDDKWNKRSEICKSNLETQSLEND